MNFPFGVYVFDLNLRILEYNGAGKVLLEKLSGESIREQASFIEMINNKVPKETMKSINNFISSGNDFFEIHFKKIDFKEENNIFFLVDIDLSILYFQTPRYNKYWFPNYHLV